MAKKTQVILTTNIKGTGNAGDLRKVSIGFWSNYLQPQGLAEVRRGGRGRGRDRGHVLPRPPPFLIP